MISICCFALCSYYFFFMFVFVCIVLVPFPTVCKIPAKTKYDDSQFRNFVFATFFFNQTKFILKIKKQKQPQNSVCGIPYERFTAKQNYISHFRNPWNSDKNKQKKTKHNIPSLKIAQNHPNSSTNNKFDACKVIVVAMNTMFCVFAFFLLFCF